MTPEDGAKLRRGDIVQVQPGEGWGACLVIVTELKAFGVQGFTPMPPDGGQAYVRLDWARFEPTGGRAVFMPAEDSDEG